MALLPPTDVKPGRRFRSLLVLPSGPTLTAEQQETVVRDLLDVVGRR